MPAPLCRYWEESTILNMKQTTRLHGAFARRGTVSYYGVEKIHAR